MEPQLPQLQPDAAVVAHQHDHGQYGGYRLSNDGGVGHALHAHAELQHKQQVKRRVHHGGHYQKVEGAAGVAGSLQNAGAHVVQQQAHDAREIDGQVRGLVRRHLRGGLHQVQHQRRHGDARAGENHAQQQRQENGGVYRLMYLFRPVRTVILADDHAGAAGHSQKEADEGVDNGPHGAHGGERLIADEIAHHPGVHHVVKLLEQVACQQRQGEADQVSRGAALGHVHVVPGGMGLVVMEREVQVMLHEDLSLFRKIFCKI